LNADVVAKAQAAKEAAPAVARATGGTRTEALVAMAKGLIDGVERILEANEADLLQARSRAVAGALLDRLRLDERRVRAASEGLLAVAGLPDPVGEIVEEWTRPNGLRIQKIRVPLGVVAVIYEARPNVTADVAGLCIKSGNAVLLRGSSVALNTNRSMVEILSEAIVAVGLPQGSLQLIEDTSREAAADLMRAKGLVDLLVPRGGPELIASVEQKAEVPYIIDGDGNCHVYVDRAAEPATAREIVINAKTQRPGVCNAAETLLVHRELSSSWLPPTLDALAERGVEVRGDETVQRLWPGAGPATDDDWGREYLDLTLAVRVVESLDEAIAHINRWGTSNAEAIVTQDAGAARRFCDEVDSGTIFVNASTRFSDGGEFGYGAEIGISTQKLHARGPMGVRELTTIKYLVWGEGQVRT
jgi:glutamate-5-semialdehyde dehydrogenase